MSEALKIPTEPPVVDELRWFLDRARQGDDSVLPKLREILDTRPELWQYYGDLALHTQRAWIDLIAGTDLMLKESVALKAREMKSELAGQNPSKLELLLSDRAVACFLQLSHADARAAEAMSDGSCKQLIDFWSKRQNGANKRFTTSLGALATLRRLLPKTTQPDQSGVNQKSITADKSQQNETDPPTELRVIGYPARGH